MIYNVRGSILPQRPLGSSTTGGVSLLQMDLLEHSAVEDVIVLSVVLEEVKGRNLAAYGRLRKLCAAADRRFFVFANEHHRCAHRSRRTTLLLLNQIHDSTPFDRDTCLYSFDRETRLYYFCVSAAPWCNRHHRRNDPLNLKHPVACTAGDRFCFASSQSEVVASKAKDRKFRVPSR